MKPVLPIRVMRTPTPDQRLEQARFYLAAYGSCTLSKGEEVLALEYDRQASLTINPMIPILDTGKLQIAYNQRRNSWECISTLFGLPIKMTDPKLFTSNVLSMTEDRIGSKISFLSKVQEFWQRYNGDPWQFANRLGKDLPSQGHMTLVTESQDGCFAHWQNTLDTEFSVWFSVAAGAVQPHYSFGFHPEVALHVFPLSVEGTEQVKAALEEQKRYVSSFLMPLVSIF